MRDYSADRKFSSDWAKQILEEKNFCILDTETTGQGEQAEIVELGILDCSGEILLHERCRPALPIPADASKIHGITDAMVAGCSPFYTLLWPMLKAVGRKHVVIFNAEYDLRLIRQSLKPHGAQLAFPTSDRRGCRIFPNGGSIYCAMLLYSQWVGDWNQRYGSYRWQKLPAGDHSAIGDCKATLDIIRRMAES